MFYVKMTAEKVRGVALYMIFEVTEPMELVKCSKPPHVTCSVNLRRCAQQTLQIHAGYMR